MSDFAKIREQCAKAVETLATPFDHRTGMLADNNRGWIYQCAKTVRNLSPAQCGVAEPAEVVKFWKFTDDRTWHMLAKGEFVDYTKPDVDYMEFPAHPTPPSKPGVVELPVEPSEAMIEAGIATFGGVAGTPENLAKPEYVERMKGNQRKAVISHYRAMLAAIAKEKP